MQAQDGMTTSVVTVTPNTTVREISALMAERRVSGLPVVNENGHLVGLVTDGDLYRRTELGTEKQSGGLLELLFQGRSDAEMFVEAHGRTARDVMTTDVIAVAPATTLRQIADLFESRGFRRVPVVKDGKVVGIVSRADVVRALASLPQPARRSELTDRQIHDLVMAQFKKMSWGLRSEWSVIVTDGIVHLWGYVPSEVDRAALRVAAEAIPGVKAVEDHTLRWLGDVGARSRLPSTLTVVGPEP